MSDEFTRAQLEKIAECKYPDVGFTSATLAAFALKQMDRAERAEREHKLADEAAYMHADLCDIADKKLEEQTVELTAARAVVKVARGHAWEEDCPDCNICNAIRAYDRAVKEQGK
jgi:hypothetical protein